MSYWQDEGQKVTELNAYENDHHQLISVGDEVVYPVWGGDFSKGKVKRIVSFKAKEWDFKKQKSVPCVRYNVLIQREVDVYRYDYKTERGDTVKQMRTFKVYYAGKIVKLKADRIP